MAADAAEEDVPPQFECTICMKLYLNPVSVPCGHNFCKDCLEQSLGYRGLCAVCRAPISGGQAVNVLLRDIIAEQYPVALAKRRQEVQDELAAGEREAAHARQRDASGAAGEAAAGAAAAEGGAGTAAPVLPMLQGPGLPLMMPYCRYGWQLTSQADHAAVEHALQGGRRLGCVLHGAGAGDSQGGICLEVEGVSHRQPGALPNVQLMGKFRFTLQEAPQLHENGFELGRCEAYFDEPLELSELQAPDSDAAGRPAEGAGEQAEAESALEVARSTLEMVERQLIRIGAGGRHAFHQQFGDAPALRGNSVTSAALEKVSLWLLGAVVMDDASRAAWLQSRSTVDRLHDCRARLRAAGTRPALQLPGAGSWMNPGQSAASSFAILIAVIALLVAKALGLFDERRSRQYDPHESVLHDLWAAFNMF